MYHALIATTMMLMHLLRPLQTRAVRFWNGVEMDPPHHHHPLDCNLRFHSNSSHRVYNSSDSTILISTFGQFVLMLMLMPMVSVRLKN